MPDEEVRLKRGTSAASRSHRLVIGEDDLAPSHAAEAPTLVQRAEQPRRPARTRAAVASGVAAMAVKLLSALVIVLGVAGYDYGGTDAGTGPASSTG